MSGTIDSFFFGPGAQRLFGSYHAPEAGVPTRGCGVVLTPALGHEYIQCHFAYKTLAVRLAEVGFPVLRFEYRGCGNAGSSFEEVTLQDWVADVERAIEQLARLSGAFSICLAGIRLGATLSALAAGSCPSVDAVLLWEPVLEGPRYLEGIRDRHARFLRALPGRRPEPENEAREIIGFRFGSDLVHDIERIAPAALGRALTAKHVLLLEGGQESASATARQALSDRCGRFLHRYEPTAERWLEQPHHVFLPGKTIEEITTWMESLC